VAVGQGSAVLYVRRSSAERFNVNQQDDPDVRSLSESWSLGAQADWRGTKSLGGARILSGRLGLGGSANHAEVRIFQERLDPGLTTNIESHIGKLDAYALGDLVTGRVTWSLSARYDLVRIPFRNRIDATRDTTSTYHRLSPRGGISVEASRGTVVYASAGQGFRAPALIELACADPLEPCPLPFALGDDPPLDPVVATTYEAGVRRTRPSHELTAAAFRTDVRDDIFLFPYDDENEPSGSTIDGYFANIAKTRRTGVELGARAWLSGVTLSGSYALTRATFQVEDIGIFSIRQEVAAPGEEVNEVEVGDRLPLVPEHTASFGAAVMVSRALELGAEARYTGERWLRGDEANEETPLADSWLTDVRATLRIAQWELRAIVRNVFDTEHATFGTFNINQTSDTLERFLTPGAPRTVQLVLRRHFGGPPVD
jgi:iron complex outermembrane recepter protein